MALQASLHSSPHDTLLGPNMYGFCSGEGDGRRLLAGGLADDDDGHTGGPAASAAGGGGLGSLGAFGGGGGDFGGNFGGNFGGGGGGGGVLGTLFRARALSEADGSQALAGPLAGCREMSLSSWYLASFSWSTMVLTGTGGTDYHPSSASDSEPLIVTVLVVLGAFIWTRVLAMFCDIATNSSPGLTAFRQQLDGLNEFIHNNNVREPAAKRRRRPATAAAAANPIPAPAPTCTTTTTCTCACTCTCTCACACTCACTCG